jgi:hypothetical protein
MRKLPIIAAFLALATPAMAADKGKVATLDDLIEKRSPTHTACYVETSVTGVFLRSTREAQAGGGLGCEAKLYNLLIAGGMRADASDWRNTASINARVGVYLNNGANAYVWASWNVPDFKIKQAGEAMVGAGAELKLDIINPQLRAFLESGVAASKFGTEGQKDAIENRFGFRFAF